MKKLNLLSLLFLVTVLILGGCSGDPAPKEQFKANGESFNLSTAKLYLVKQATYSSENGDFVYRNYFITDGNIIPGEPGWSITDYTDATYFFGFEVLVPADGGFVAGSYPSMYYFADVETSGIYMYGETTNTGFYYETNDGEPGGTFTIVGGMNDEETMTIKFSGTLSHWIYAEEAWGETLFTGSLLVKAEVLDARPA